MEGSSDCGLWLPPAPQDNASKLLLALMESRHDSENAERILISLRPQELVRLGGRLRWEADPAGCEGMGLRAQRALCSRRGHSSRPCPPGGRHQEGLPAGGGA